VSLLDKTYIAELGLAERLSEWKKVCRETLEEEKAE
jgi:hypothetical protein